MKNIIIILFLAAVIYFAVKKFKKKSMDTESNTSDLGEPSYYWHVTLTGDVYHDVAAFILLKEGGASNNQSDSAHTDPAPCPYSGLLNGKMVSNVSGVHTMKGITWTAFKAHANELGYTADCETFFKMPIAIWTKIYQKVYLDPFMKATNSPVINLYISLWSWGSGVGGANHLLKSLPNIQNYLDKYGERATLKLLIEARINFYKRLAQQKPEDMKFLKGWESVALSYYKNFISYAKN